MGKATRIKRETAREKIAAQRAAARKAEIRNRIFITGGSILGVLVILAAFLIFKAVSGSSGPSAPGTATGTALPASVSKDLTTVPAATLESVGSGTAYPKSVSPVSAPPLTSAGKPEVLYIGAEYCPYCAAERWAMAVALSRFGTLSGLHGIHSSSSDVYASTPSVTFYQSHYTSKYLTFTPVEEETTNESTPLQKPTAQQSALAAKDDNPPYTTSQGANAIPFIDFGGKYLVHGAQYNPQLLHGQTWAAVAAALHDGTSQIAQGADGAANMITAAICKMTGDQPSSVCTSPAIRAAQGQL
jgi:thiol-disulfide isomerase/thioredoxin